MKYSKDELKAALTLEHYPRSASYDAEWMLENYMGPNAIWLAEALSQAMDLQPGMRVLDLGCGKAASSIFLAKEFGVQIWAADLWIGASENWKRIQQAGLSNQVFPMHVEAHDLPFADGFFDAIVSLDAYHYFGTDDMYLGQIAQYLHPAGQIGIVVPGLMNEFEKDVPAELAPYWEWDFCSFHSPEWWRRHWSKTGLVSIETADNVPDGWKHWLTWQQVCFAQGVINNQQEEEMLKIDQGRNLGFTRLVARK